MASGGLKKCLLSMMLFLLVFLSYQPFYSELKQIQANATLNNNIVGLMVSIYPYFYVMLGIMCLGLTIYYMALEMS